MVNYRRNQTPGGTYFFTLTLQNRKSSMLIKHIQTLRKSIKRAKDLNPFRIHAIVILPDHIHLIMQLPEGDANYSRRIQQIKSLFTKNIIENGENLIKNKRGEYNLWQRRFWDHLIRNDIEYQQYVNYIHYNPVKHRLVMKVSDWPYSSFHRFVERGILSEDWSFCEDLYLE